MKIIIPTQDPKYGIQVTIDSSLPDDPKIYARLVNVATGEPIPKDEPVFMLRAKDALAEQTISYYLTMAAPREHKEAIVHRINDFIEFRINNLDRMKAPDTVYPFPKVGK